MHFVEWVGLVIGLFFLFLVFADARYSRPFPSLFRLIVFFVLGIAFLVPSGERLHQMGMLLPILFLIMFLIGVTILILCLWSLSKSRGIHASNFGIIIFPFFIALGLILPALARIKRLGIANFFN